MIAILSFAYFIIGVGFLLVGKDINNPSVIMLGCMLFVFGVVTLVGYAAG